MKTDLGPDRPFPGLRPYNALEHEWFFGREEQTLGLYRLLDRGRLITVVGSSGSGKSSLVRAGLLPLLAKETGAAGTPRWGAWEMRPGNEPLQRLTDALAGEGPTDVEDVAAFEHGGRRQSLGFLLRQSSFGLLDALKVADGTDGAIPLLLVDQFEELFRFADLPGTEVEKSARRQEAAAFVQLLLEATRAADSRLRVIATLRSDYFGDCARFHGLPEAVTGSQYLVPSLTRDQREQTIRGPICKAGGTITDELVERLLADSAEELDQLPVLQHALMRTWHQSATPRHLTWTDYRNVGGLSAAISQHADSLLMEPDLRGRLVAVEQVFRALAELDRFGRAIRRPLPFRQLVNETGVSENDVRAVTSRFRCDDCSFLVPPLVDDQELDDTDVVDIAHEALIRRWTKMTHDANGLRRGWLADEVADGRRYVALAEIARGSTANRPALLPLEQVEERLSWWASRPRTAAWAERYGGNFGTVERLLADSARALEQNRLEKEQTAIREAAEAARAAAEREIRTARRAILTRTQAVAFLGAFVLAMAMNFGFVYETAPFSSPLLIVVCAVTTFIFILSLRGDRPSGWRLSLDQTVVAFFVLDLAALAYLIYFSGGLSNSPFTVFLLLLPMNGVLLEEPARRVRWYFGVVFFVAMALAVEGATGDRAVPVFVRWQMMVAQILVLLIAFFTAVLGYRNRTESRATAERPGRASGIGSGTGAT